ncbi:MAG TPA: histidine phosphatase family protein [candidate division Zixibacteria bacterium]|nr:histidine phosphatase family protein [candidate division Zixibacteria bacterium]
MKTSILLIRHGETDWNASGRWQGQSDVPLNENGIVQANLLAKRLSTWPIRAIYCSDLKRAAKTASILGDALGLEPVSDIAWRERNGGDFEGLTGSQLNEMAAFQKLRSVKNWKPPNGESNLQVAVRAQEAFDKIINNHADQMVAVVSHGGTIISLLSQVLGMPPGDRARIRVSRNTGFSIVEVGERGQFLVSLNDETHLMSD